MVKPACKQTNQKKRKNRAGKKTHANRVISHSRWLKRQALKTLSRVEPTENISSITTSESEIPTGSPQKILNSETEIIVNSKTKPPISDDFNGLKSYLLVSQSANLATSTAAFTFLFFFSSLITCGAHYSYFTVCTQSASPSRL